VNETTTVNRSKLAYALLLGQGRSGTNYLLHLLNQSPLTHCRNEPDEVEDSALRRLTPYRFFVDEPEELEAVYDDAIRGAALTLGPRDHIVQYRKKWLFPGSARPGFFYLRNRYRLAHVFRKGIAMNGREIRFPRWMTTAARLGEAFHVFKLNAAVGLASWVFENRPEAKAIHIVRHPGGFTKSWLARWVEGAWNRAPDVKARNERLARERLLELARHDEAWAKRLGDVERMDFVEVELWWWRYCGERTWEAGNGRPGYRCVIFEELAHDPAAIARDVYELCGLPWDDWLAERITAISSRSSKIASAWKDELDDDVVHTIERVLQDSVMSSWWDA